MAGRGSGPERRGVGSANDQFGPARIGAVTPSRAQRARREARPARSTPSYQERREDTPEIGSGHEEKTETALLAMASASTLSSRYVAASADFLLRRGA